METVKRNWKAFLGGALFVLAIIVFLLVYMPASDEYDSENSRLSNEINLLQYTIVENERYAGVQGELDEAKAEVEQSRKELYEHFPAQLREEDQIMYVVYLEELFGTEINFSFGSAEPLAQLSDEAILGGLTLTVNYETDYEGYKKMIQYLATDSRITSIQYSTMDYNSSTDTAQGSLTLLCYLLVSDMLDYQPPEVDTPDNIGKPNIFG